MNKHTCEMEFVRESETSDIYVCPICGSYESVPRGCDKPVCEAL
mgnify:CR=1 FL=1